MKKEFSLLLSTLLISACSTNTKNIELSAEFKPAQDFTQRITLQPTDRTPAEAPTAAWRPATLQVTVGPSGTAQIRKDVQVEEFFTWKEQQPYTDYEDRAQEMVVETTCQDMTCNKGAGKSAVWDKFFSAPKEEKASILDQAISGIGVKSAEALLSNKYFSSKPRSWADFCEEIKDAANKGVIQKSVATTVMYNDRAENSEKLGYGPKDCQVQTRACAVWISKLTKVPVIKYRTVEKTRLIQAKTFSVNVDISNVKLLPFEKETISLKVNEDGALSITNESGLLNNYRISYSKSGNEIRGELTGEHRNLIDLTSKVIKQDYLMLSNNNSSVTFYIDVDPQFIPSSANDPHAQLVVDYKVQTCDYNFTGRCLFSSWKDSKIGSVVITEARTPVSFSIPGDISLHKRVQVNYTVTRKNSVFFSSKPTKDRDTDALNTPKE